ncbi:MAG: glucosamine-6-phosphate deaminase [Methanomassiliicoccales archaeon]|nr:glucosamine-6-phosphate deaminase [Methanomassiliicoccales archaeon]
MKVYIYNTADEMAHAAANLAASILTSCVAAKGNAVFVAATGTSQLAFLAALTTHKEIPWDKTIMFHLDEYIGLDESHPASFRNYLRKHLISKVPLGKYYLINGNAPDPETECRRLAEIISAYKIDIAFVGIGENGHLAFNDPPADFDTDAPYIVVKLDETSRFQQVKEGWFTKIEEVPHTAITMSIKCILKAEVIIAVVPEARKALAVKQTLEGPITPLCPATALRLHPNVHLFLDKDSASMLDLSKLRAHYDIVVKERS